MLDTFDVFSYMSYIRRRWRLVAYSCCVAVTAAFAASLLIPRQYTAIARIVIDPPAGSDPRSTMVVSPIYLESLRTFEHFAAGDSLFQKAMDKFALRSPMGNRPIESIKRRVLKVEVVRNTRILEISVTLPDPRMAEALARFLAESSVALNRSMAGASDEDLLQGIERQEREARAALEVSDAAWARMLVDEPVEDLQAASDADGRLREDLQQQSVAAELELAGAATREKRAAGAELEEIRREEADAHSRLDQLRARITALDGQIAARTKVLAARIADRDRLDARRKGEQAQLAAVESRLREDREAAGFRGERLTVIDPGIVPERPSSPNAPLNCMAALLLGLLLPLLYLVMEMHFRAQREQRQPELGARRGYPRALAKAVDD